MVKRLLLASLVSMLVLLGLSLLTQLFLPQLGGEAPTAFGGIPVGDCVGALVAMALGGALARDRGFIALAVFLQAAVWTVIVLWLALRPGSAAVATMSLGAILRYNAMALGASLLAAGLGAWLGVTLALRARPAVGP